MELLSFTKRALDSCVTKGSPQALKGDAGAKEYPPPGVGTRAMKGAVLPCLLCGSEFVELVEFRRHKKRHNMVKSEMTELDVH